MNRYWSLSQAIYQSLHQWPLMVMFALAGCLAGALGAALWPSNYRAEANLYVALNPYRTYEDSRFQAMVKPRYSNVDNYKNWQMTQLEAAVFFDSVLAETLEQLRADDPYWNNVQPDELRRTLDVEWRTAGEWTLVAEAPEAGRAEQSVRAWSRVILARVAAAVEAARETITLDEEILARARARGEAELRLDRLESAAGSLQAWAAGAGDLPGDRPLPEMERWSLLAIVSQVTDLSPGWQAVLERQPVTEAPPDDTLRWVEEIETYIERETELIEERMAALEAEIAELEERFEETSDRSLAFSPNMEIEPLREVPAQALRPYSLLVLIGGLIGLLSFVVLRLAQITRLAPALEPAA